MDPRSRGTTGTSWLADSFQSLECEVQMCSFTERITDERVGKDSQTLARSIIGSTVTPPRGTLSRGRYPATLLPFDLQVDPRVQDHQEPQQG